MLKYIQVQDEVGNLFSDGPAIIIRYECGVVRGRDREVGETEREREREREKSTNVAKW